MLTTVKLHGALATVAGRAEWVLDVMSPGEAIRAIECQVGRVFRHLLEKDKEGVSYRVVCDGRDVAGEKETLIGVGLMAGGIMQMFFGPKPPVTSSHDQTDRGNGKDMSSYLFSGPVNTIAQGGPVPLLFGHMIVGSQTISMSIRTASTTVGGDQPGSDAFRQEIADAMNMGTIAAKTTRDTTEKLIRGESTDDSGS
jgi:predicted phage tail protein